VVAALERLSSRGGTTTKALVRDREALLVAPRQLAGRRIVIAEPGGVAALANALGRALRDLGAHTLLSHHPDGQVQADEANAFEVEVFLALQVRNESGCHTAYWSTTGYESIGGHNLAKFIGSELAHHPVLGPIEAEGMRLGVLRATRMPAVVCAIGPPAVVVEHAGSLTTSLRSAISRWIAEPADV
jgi:N-acetylmuramoyl-L-alanine amidase